jgi:hypothetical protein
MQAYHLGRSAVSKRDSFTLSSPGQMMMMMMIAGCTAHQCDVDGVFDYAPALNGIIVKLAHTSFRAIWKIALAVADMIMGPRSLKRIY